MKKLLVIVLATIGTASVLVGLGVYIFAIFFESKTDYKVEKIVISPSGEYTATFYTGMGGGAAGWCSQIVAVNTIKEPFSIETEGMYGEHQVFRARCSVKVDLEWRSDTHLLISFSSRAGAKGMSVDMNEIDKTGVITIDYSFGANKALQIPKLSVIDSK